MSARGYGKTQCTHRRLTSRAKHKHLSTTPWGKCHRPKMRHVSSTPQAPRGGTFPLPHFSPKAQRLTTTPWAQMPLIQNETHLFNTSSSKGWHFSSSTPLAQSTAFHHHSLAQMPLVQNETRLFNTSNSKGRHFSSSTPLA
ncbi:hypothetical protein X472_00763 [Bartonella bacilliformis San Pedro600-02]|nr:hypothetical protein X472_00763 [Bartonella bacilliformis San Pedro600-02]KEG17538.1 hypothetical protein H705_00190 [Bartonella bacilliformis Cond044]KEG23606.1 hypothetical protein H703_00187 [Bartonella bacilliformis Ver075]